MKKFEKVVKLAELEAWLKWKQENHFDPHQLDYKVGYLDALENLLQDLAERRLPVYLFDGEESEIL